MEGYLFLKKGQNKGTYGDSLVPKWSRRHCSIVNDPQRGSYLVARKRVEEGYLDHNKCISNAIPFASSVVNLGNYSISVQDCLGPDGEVSGGVIRLRDTSAMKETERKETIELRDKSQETAKKWKVALTEAQNAPRGTGTGTGLSLAETQTTIQTQTQAQAQANPFSYDQSQNHNSAEDKENIKKSNISPSPSPGPAKAKRSVGFMQPQTVPMSSDAQQILQPAFVFPTCNVPTSVTLSIPSSHLSLVPERVTPSLAQEHARDTTSTRCNDPLHGHALSNQYVCKADDEEVELVWVAEVVERRFVFILQLVQAVCLVVSIIVAATTLMPNAFIPQASHFTVSMLQLPAPEPLLFLSAPETSPFACMRMTKSASHGSGHLLTCANPKFVPEHLQTLEPYELLHTSLMQPDGKHLSVAERTPLLLSAANAAQVNPFSAPVLLDVTISGARDELQLQLLRHSAEAKLLAAVNKQQQQQEQERYAQMQAEKESLEQRVALTERAAQRDVVAEPAPPTWTDSETLSVAIESEQIQNDSQTSDVEDSMVPEETQSYEEKSAAPISLAARTGGGVLKVVTSPFRAVGWLVGKVVK